jgi:TRAP transporter TAXI family solute receptor
MVELLSTRRSVLLGTALAIGQAAPAQSQALPPGFAVRTARANSGTVGIVSGGVNGTYIRIAADLASVLDDGDRLRVLPMIGKGSVQNLSDIVFLRGVDLGIVQSDALAFVVREQALPGVSQTISYIAKLYDEEVHVLAGPEIGNIADLAGKPVNVDVRGSGTAMTAELIFKLLNIPVDLQHDSQEVAFQRLRGGEAAAIVYVTGKPARLFSTIPADAGLHFLSIPATAEVITTYLPAQLDHEAYPTLVSANAPVQTVAVGALMAAYSWQPGTERRMKVDRFVAALTERLAELQKPPSHPKWREVNLAAQAPGWTRWEPEPAQPSPLIGSRVQRRTNRWAF